MNIKIRKSAGLFAALIAFLGISLAMVTVPVYAAPTGHQPTQGTHPLGPTQRAGAGQDDPMSIGFPPLDRTPNRIVSPPAWFGRQSYINNVQPCGWSPETPYLDYGSTVPSPFSYPTVGSAFPNLGDDMSGVPGGPNLMSLYVYEDGGNATLWDVANESINPALGPCNAQQLMWWFGP